MGLRLLLLHHLLPLFTQPLNPGRHIAREISSIKLSRQWRLKGARMSSEECTQKAWPQLV